MNSLSNELEAVLFASKGVQSMTQLERILDIGREDLEEAIRALTERYNLADGALEVRCERGGLMLGLKPKYYGTVRDLIPVPARDAVLATLNHIAREQPVMQSTIVAIRGQKAYNHIRDLVERGWVNKKRAGSSYLLRTTKKFAETFHCTDNPDEIRKLLEEAAIPYLAEDKD